MTTEQLNELIDGEVYLFKYDDKTIKRMFKGIMTTETNFSLYNEHYAILSTLEPTPAVVAYMIDQLELIGVYQTELDRKCL